MGRLSRQRQDATARIGKDRWICRQHPLKSLTRDGWILSLSGWRDEKAVVRWRTLEGHHLVQEAGRSEILLDYHLRVGQITHDTEVPAGQKIQEQRLDETQVGEGTTLMLIDAKWPESSCTTANAPSILKYLGLNSKADGLVSWDVFDAVLTPGDVILLMSWKSRADADAFAKRIVFPPGGRLRQVRVVRDYGMFDRREAPQYFPAANDERRST
jgi:hypothetical protein